ncbi:MAG: ATP-dependent DNA helicase RecQ [Gemmatimonadota bacterium]
MCSPANIPTLAHWEMATMVDAQLLLAQRFGHAEFRPLQTRVIEPVLAGRDVLAVLPTGGGKSLCFQVPALLTPGLTLVISPLVALMQDQVTRLVTRGVAAAALNSTLTADEQQDVLCAVAQDRVRMLYLSPERLPRLVDELAARGVRVARLAVDEAHCIVEWGHDFRPSYRALRRCRSALGAPPCIALTGSATPAVRDEIRRSLGFTTTACEIVGSFDRRNLRLEVHRVSSVDHRLTRLVRLVRDTLRPVIVYAPTRGLTEGLARVLREQGVVAAPYHAGLSVEARRSGLEQFLDGRLRVMTATCAFGMGIDKPDIELVVHWNLPSTPESYYQEAGRAGRDGREARCVLLFHPGDGAMPRRQLATTFPKERVLEECWRDPSRRGRLPAAVVAAADRLEAELRPDRGPIDWSGVRRRRREAERRLEAMLGYAGGTRCRRAALLGWFGERVVRCSGCDRCGSGVTRE